MCSPFVLELTRTGRGPEIRTRYSEHEVARALAERYAASPNRELACELQVAAALTHPQNARPVGEPLSRAELVEVLTLHVTAYRACRAAGEADRAEAVLESLARYDPGGELRRRLQAE